MAPSSALAPPPFWRNSVPVGRCRLGAGPRAAAGRDGGCFCSFGGTQRTHLPSGSPLPGGPRGVRLIACPDRVSLPRPPAARSPGAGLPRHFPGPSAGGPGPRPLAGSAPGGGWAAGAAGKGEPLPRPRCASRSRASLSRLLPPGAGLPPRGRPGVPGEAELPDPVPPAMCRDVSASGHLRVPRPRGWGVGVSPGWGSGKWPVLAVWWGRGRGASRTVLPLSRRAGLPSLGCWTLICPTHHTGCPPENWVMRRPGWTAHGHTAEGHFRWKGWSGRAPQRRWPKGCDLVWGRESTQGICRGQARRHRAVFPPGGSW